MAHLRFHLLQDPDEFADRVRDFLVVHEAEHSLLFGILSNLSSGWAYGADSGGGPVLALVEEGAGIAAVGVCTPPRNLVISRSATVEAVGALAGGLSGLRLAVCGSAPLSPALARRLPAVTGRLPVVRYGTTESGLNISNICDEPRSGTVGVPLPGELVAFPRQIERAS